MSDEVQADLHQPDKADQPETGVPVAVYHVLPYREGPGEDELYSFREAAEKPEPEPELADDSEPKEAARKPRPSWLFIGLMLAFVALAILSISRFAKSKAPALYVDMGARQFDPARLSGRLIVRWQGSAAYELYVDPIDQWQTAEFQAVAQDPPHALSVTIRLHDSSGVVVCRKEIVFPTQAQPAGSPDRAQALAPRKTANGDTVQNMAGTDGQIAEITVSGSLPCSQQEYKRLTGWDFSMNFPNVSEQAEWLRHENSLADGKLTSKGRGAPPQVQRLSMPIEGDDVIVGDNPLRGTVTTGGGRVFWLGAGGMRSRTAGWQVFPAAIHFRCEKTGSCVLTRFNSRSPLLARLMR
ncbi:MAG: hypothetical protein ACLQG3_11825 [Terracidiphilus sp.]